MFQPTAARAFWILLVLVAVPKTLFAKDVSYVIVKQGDGFGLSAPPPQTVETRLTVPANEKLVIHLTCPSGVDCGMVSGLMTLRAGGGGGGELPTESPTEGATTLVLAQVPAGGCALAIRVGQQIVSPVVQVDVGSSGGSLETSVSTTKLSDYDWIRVDYRDVEKVIQLEIEPIAPHGGDYYSVKDNEAAFVVTPLGNVLRRPMWNVDEDDRVTVYVVGQTGLLDHLRVRRISAFHRPGQISVLGAEATIQGGERHAAEIGYTVVQLGDFERGRGEVEIASVTSAGTQVLGTFDFGVDALYSGAYSFGPIATWLEDPQFGLLPGGEITRTEDGGTEGKYVLAYTHFIWGRRDIEKRVTRPIEHLNPAMALNLEQPFRHVMLGLSLDVLNGSVFVIGGIHGSRVRSLDPQLGLKEGDIFAGSPELLPIRDEWMWKPFLGATIELRVASEFFSKTLVSRS